MEEVDHNFDQMVDQLEKHLWVLRDTKWRSGVSTYEKVLRDEWEEIRRIAAKSQDDADNALSERVLTHFLGTIEEIKAFIAKAIADI